MLAVFDNCFCYLTVFQYLLNKTWSHIQSVKLISDCYLMWLRFSELSAFQDAIFESRQLWLLLTRIYFVYSGVFPYEVLEIMATTVATSDTVVPFSPGTVTPLYHFYV